ncbi:MAG: hypothetical protein ACPLQP_03340 [Moorellaceae bacterium]
MRKTRKLAKTSKIDLILASLAGNQDLTLREAAKIAYGATNEKAQAKVVRLLSAHRYNGRTSLRVRGGKIIACP